MICHPLSLLSLLELEALGDEAMFEDGLGEDGDSSIPTYLHDSASPSAPTYLSEAPNAPPASVKVDEFGIAEPANKLAA